MAISILGTPVQVTGGNNYTAETGSNRIVVICLARRTSDTGSNISPAITALSFGSASLANSQVVSAKEVVVGLGANTRAGIWFVREANIPSGANAVSATWGSTMSGSDLFFMFTLGDVDQTSTVDGTGASETHSGGFDPWTGSLTISNNAIQILTGAFGGGGTTVTPDAGWTEVQDASNSNHRCHTQYATGKSSGSLTYTADLSASSVGALVAASFNQVSATPPSFSVSPTVTSQTDTAYTLSYTPSAASTFYVAAVPSGASTPSAAQIKAGTGGGILHATSEAVTGADTTTLTISGTPFPIYKLCALLNNAGGDSSIVTLDNEPLDNPTGFEYTTVAMKEISGISAANPAAVTCTSHGLTSGDLVRIWAVTGTVASSVNNLEFVATVTNSNTFTIPISTVGLSYTSGGFVSKGESILENASPAAADGDIMINSTTSSPGGYTVNIAADGVPEVLASGDTSRQTFQARFYDVSAQGWSDASLVTIYINNQEPDLAADPSEVAVYAFPTNVAITPVDLSVFATDPELDPITVTAVDALPTGLSISSNNLQGTPTVGGIYNVTMRWTDIAGAFAEGDVTIIVGNVTVPNVEGEEQFVGEAELINAYLGVALEPDYGSILTPGTITNQEPDGGSSVPPFTIVTLSVAASDLLNFLMSKRKHDEALSRKRRQTIRNQYKLKPRRRQ